MSLVAYAASSDEESDHDQENNGIETSAIIPPTKPGVVPSAEATKVAVLGHISDEDDDDYAQQEITLQDLKPPSCNKFALMLPKPKTAVSVLEEEDNVDMLVTPTFAKLPMPRAATVIKEVIEEEDDEFLHKKAVPTDKEAVEKPPPVKGRVKISIPSLKDFGDVDKELAEKSKTKDIRTHQPKGCGLLSILPTAKSEQNFTKQQEHTPQNPSTSTTANAPSRPAFIPDTVRNRRPAHNTEGVDGIKQLPKKAIKKPAENTTKPALVSVSDSDASDDETSNGDFFSLNKEEKLPEVSANEITALVAKRAAQIVETSTKYLNEKAAEETAEAEHLQQVQDEDMRQAQKRYHEQQLDAEAMDALVGKNAKRRRKEERDIQVIDINSAEVLPDRDEWMRTALTSSTHYQPTGVLNDEEPAAGTRRKHQITYLAHKAKANEAELQAMWSANRQNRRATQSKYGF